MRLAIVADWLTTFGGAEHVLAAFHRMWPAAPIFTTVLRPSAIGPLGAADVRSDAFLQSVYGIIRKHQLLLPLMPRAIERSDLSGFDVVLSSSHAVAKGVIVPPTARHICYCHTPMRYAWEMEDEYLKDFGIVWPLRPLIKRELKRLRRWDLSTAKRVDLFIANSSETAARIQRTYGRESIVIPPPVEDRFYQISLQTKNQQLKTSNSFLALGRLVPYKRFDLLIELAHRLKLPLMIGGTGSDEARLKALAGPTVTFLGYVPDADLPRLYAESSALLFPQHEDAGIVPMEAQASGLPVIAYGKGGVVDVVEDGKTGILFAEQSVEVLETAVQKFRSVEWDRSAIRESARRFHSDRFQEAIEKIVMPHGNT